MKAWTGMAVALTLACVALVCDGRPALLTGEEARDVIGGQCTFGCVEMHQWRNHTTYFHCSSLTAHNVYADPPDDGAWALNMNPGNGILKRYSSGTDYCPSHEIAKAISFSGYIDTLSTSYGENRCDGTQFGMELSE